MFKFSREFADISFDQMLICSHPDLIVSYLDMFRGAQTLGPRIMMRSQYVGQIMNLFPPFCLIGRVLRKVIDDRISRAIIVVPNWTCQAWFPTLLDLLIDTPARLPHWQDLITLPHDGSCHRLFRTLNLTACVVSGQRSQTKAFQAGLPMRHCSHGDGVPRRLTTWRGSNGEFGVVNRKLIQVRRLKL